MAEYYGIHYDSVIEHHGIKGQKWGVRNGPPYPLNRMSGVMSLNDSMNKWNYGVVINNKIITDMNKINWADYRTIPITQMDKYHTGICYDYVNYQHDVFKKRKLKDNSYMFVIERGPNDVVTHTFSTVDVNNKKYWFESSWLPHQGVHEISSYTDVVNALREEYGVNNSYDLYKYDPTGMDKRLTANEFFEKTTNDLVQSYSKKRKQK